MKTLAVKPTLAIVAAILIAVAGLALWSTIRSAESDRPLIDEVQEALDRDAEKERFTGPLGDFLVYGLVDGASPSDAENIQCVDGTVPVTDRALVQVDELWSDEFGPQDAGWSCADGGEIVAIISGGEDGHDVRPDGARFSRFHFGTPFLKVVIDAPLDRLELTEVKGHPALLQHPVEGYPYSTASLSIIERFPEGELPGTAVSIAGVVSTEEALALGERLIQ